MSDLLQERRDEWRKRYAGELLTQEQADQLPHGAIVELIWSGGNGPHRYIVQRIERFDHPQVLTDQEMMLGYSVDKELTSVGKDRYHTQVRRVSST